MADFGVLLVKNLVGLQLTVVISILLSQEFLRGESDR